MTLVHQPAPRSDAVERCAGLEFPDPFRPLEDAADPAVVAWQDAEAKLVEDYVAAVPGIGRLRETVKRCSAGHSNPFEPPNPPVFGGGLWFRIEHAPAATQAHVI